MIVKAVMISMLVMVGSGSMVVMCVMVVLFVMVGMVAMGCYGLLCLLWLLLVVGRVLLFVVVC